MTILFLVLGFNQTLKWNKMVKNINGKQVICPKCKSGENITYDPSKKTWGSGVKRTYYYICNLCDEHFTDPEEILERSENI